MNLFQILGTIAIKNEDANRNIDETADKAKGLASGLGEKFTSAGKTISGIGKKLAPVSLAVKGAGIAAIKVAADFDAGMSKVAAISGATGDDLQALRDKAREMGAKTKFSASEAASAMEYMAMAGWKTGDMLGGVEGIMNLAAASGENLATTSDIVTDALTAFGLTAADSGHFADILAAASSNANTNVSMMGETFKYAAPIAGALGYSAEDTAEAIGLMANAGIKGSQAGTSLRGIMTSLTGDIKITGDKLGDVTIATTNADGSMRDFSDILADCRGAFSKLSESEKTNTAEALVGKNAMSGFLAIMNAGEGDIKKLSTAIENCDGSAEQMAATMQDNLKGQLTILKSQLEELSISFGEMLMPAVRNIVSVIQGFVDKLNSMDEGTRRVILTIGLALAAATPVLLTIAKIADGITKVIGTVTKVIGVVQNVMGAVSKLFAVLMANPIALVIAAVVALVAGFIYLWNTSEDFRNFWISLWENIKSIVTAVVNAIGAFLVAAWNAMKSVAEAVWNAIKTAVSTAINAIKTVITTVMNAIKATVTAVWNAIKTVVVTVLSAIRATVTTAWNGIKNTVTSVLNGIKSVCTSVWNSIKSVVSNVINGIKSVISSGLNAAKSTVSSVLNGIKGQFTSVFNGVKSFMGGVVNWLKGIFNFSWSLPKIKLPHFSISGSFSLAPPSIPHIGVSWYKKAMDEPKILTEPTIFGFNPQTGMPRGGGEAGDEVVSGKDTLLNLIRDTVAAENATLTEKVDMLIAILSEYLPQMAGMQVVLEDGTLVGRLAPGISRYVKKDISRDRKNVVAGRGGSV